MLIDSHCHLTDEKFTDVKDTLKKAFEAGVEKVIIPATSLADAKRGVVIATQENQYCLVGIHPEEVEKMFDDIPDGFRVKPGMTDNEKLEIVMEEMEKIIDSSERVVGIGEIGLDYYWDKEKKTEKTQVEIFRRQIELAVSKNLPVAIHMRNAEEEMKKELELFVNNYPGLPRPTTAGLAMTGTNEESPRTTTYKEDSSGEKFRLRGQFHCFAGSPEFLEMILEMGFYVSFCGNITYKSAGNLRELVKKVPINRLLMETDSPYLSPEPLRGTVNSPANVKITAEFIASELNISYTELAEKTSLNTKCLYSLES